MQSCCYMCYRSSSNMKCVAMILFFPYYFLIMPCKAEQPLGSMDLQEKEVQYMKPV